MFYSAKKWIAASVLTVGILVQTYAGHLPVRDILNIDTFATVYNFTVEQSHTYYVGKHELLVHNSCSGHLENVLAEMRTSAQQAYLNLFKNNLALLSKFINGELSREAFLILYRSGSNLLGDEVTLAALTRDLKKDHNSAKKYWQVSIILRYGCEKINGKLMSCLRIFSTRTTTKGSMICAKAITK